MSASLPPGLRRINAILSLTSAAAVLLLPSSRRVEPCHTHVLAVSAVGGGSASKSITVVHCVS